jgi:hemoglobin
VRGTSGRAPRPYRLRRARARARFGAKVAAQLSNGDWAYGSYDATGAKANENFAACRTCHLPVAGKDFVARYDEHFAARR